MYWNTGYLYAAGDAISWIVTLDVLKYAQVYANTGAGTVE